MGNAGHSSSVSSSVPGFNGLSPSIEKTQSRDWKRGALTLKTDRLLLQRAPCGRPVLASRFCPVGSGTSLPHSPRAGLVSAQGGRWQHLAHSS